ncbi:hypothetical protein [Tianweitania sediminis]|uniref:Uncharacterized protein n=1 Tax=Tianweitania sediminis TaxID=1502156 RepID=A0A8J7R2B6_9HYPH|nr:hypothetical protein [Tianweitania sediminis]MBP0439573.1 hypothetical protein [Tianweitania sediminis]
MVGLIRQSVGLHTNDPTLPLLQRDALIDERTVGLVDFSSGWAYSKANPGLAGARVKDLVRGGADAILQDNLAYDGKGFVFLAAGAGALEINLGSNWRLPIGVTHFAFGIWLNLADTGYGSTGTSDVPYSIAGLYKSGAPTGYQWLLSLSAARPAGTLKSLQFIANGRSVVANMSVGGLRYLVGEYQVVGSNHLSRLYVDKQLVAESAATAQAYVDPAPTDPAVIGRVVPFAVSHGGATYRAWLQRLDSDGASLISVMERDWAANRDRLVS